MSMTKIYTLSADGSIHSELESLLYLKENLEFQIESSQKELEIVNKSIRQITELKKEENTLEDKDERLCLQKSL